jgi:hypothetical protein
MKTHRLIIAAAVLVSAGCESMNEKTATEEDFGNSVRHMVQAQTVNPSPSTDMIQTGDGQRIENALESYRTDVGSPERVKDDIVIDVSD